MIVHDATYVQSLKNLSNPNAKDTTLPSYPPNLKKDEKDPDFPDTFISANSLPAALRAAGAVRPPTSYLNWMNSYLYFTRFVKAWTA